MKVLLDTHAFMWFIGGNQRLSIRARQLIESPDTDRLLSVAVLWEMAIKSSLGRLDIRLDMPTFVEQHVYGSGINLLRVEPKHLEVLRHLPVHHRDPFDRLIIAQSLAEEIPIVSKDEAFELYDVSLLW